MQAKLDLYTDYLLSRFGQTSATGLSRLVDGAVSHDLLALGSCQTAHYKRGQYVRDCVLDFEVDTLDRGYVGANTHRAALGFILPADADFIVGYKRGRLHQRGSAKVTCWPFCPLLGAA